METRSTNCPASALEEALRTDGASNPDIARVVGAYDRLLSKAPDAESTSRYQWAVARSLLLPRGWTNAAIELTTTHINDDMEN
jgi:hypothetical protein